MNSRHQNTRRLAIFGFAGNLLLSLLKLTIGFWSNSQALIADGFNSAGDLLSSIMTYIGNRISAKPYDQDHPYGHGKAEYVFSLIIGCLFLMVGYNIIETAIRSLINGRQFHLNIGLIIVPLVTILVKFFLYLYSIKLSRRHNSLLIRANASDHKIDMLISGFTLISSLSLYYGLTYIDIIISAGIAFYIFATGFHILSAAYYVLMDTTLDEQLKQEFITIVEQVPGVEHLDTIISKPVGIHYLLLVKVSVDAYLTVLDSHDIACQVKQTLLAYELIDDVIVHINPAQYHPRKNYLR